MGNILSNQHPAAPAAPGKPAPPTNASSPKSPAATASPAAPASAAPHSPAAPAAPAAPSNPSTAKVPQSPGAPAAPAVPKGKSIKFGGARKRRGEKSTLIKKKYYGRKKGKVIQIYGHKIARRIGRHRFVIKWKTTKKNLPGKTYYGKFYNTRKAARQGLRAPKTRRHRRRRRKR